MLTRRGHSFTERAINRHVGKMLKMHRLAAGLSEQQLAELVDLSYSTIQKHERSNVMIGAGRLYEFAKTFGVEPAAFFVGLEESLAYPMWRHDPVLAQTLETFRIFHRIESSVIRSTIAGFISAAAGMKSKRRRSQSSDRPYYRPQPIKKAARHRRMFKRRDSK